MIVRNVSGLRNRGIQPRRPKNHSLRPKQKSFDGDSSCPLWHTLLVLQLKTLKL